MTGDHIAAALRQWRDAAEKLQTSVCQAVALLNASPEAARCSEARDANAILRQALATYADDYMEQPVTEEERALVASKHRRGTK